MDPITVGIQAVGLGMKLFGAFSGASSSSQFADQTAQYAQQMNAQEQQKFGLEKQVNQQRQAAMELSARRQQLEIFRNNQRARAMGLNASVSQGAQYGSGMPGGLASIDAQSRINNQGVNQNLEIGRNIFGLNNSITDINATESGIKSKYQTQQAQYQAQQTTDQAWQGFGGSLIGSAGTLGNIGGAIGGGISQMSNLFSPGSLSGGFGK